LSSGQRHISIEGLNPAEIYGINNTNLKHIKSYFPKLKVIARGNVLNIAGDDEVMDEFERKFALFVQHYHSYNTLTENNIDFSVDEHNNVYATKQTTKELPEDFYFPCVVSHTDTVHNLDTINIREENLYNAQGELKLSYKAYNNEGKPTGIGGDDKCGVFACLTLLHELPNVKAAFFVSEETGCHGSLKASEEFFSNVGYGIQFDAPENWMITEKCFGQVLFDRGSEFFETCDKSIS
jgi:hypothetical protein